MIFCLKIEEFLLFLTCCFKFTTHHESKFASTCTMCFPNTCKTVLCSGNQFPVKIHIFLLFNFVPIFMELPCSISVTELVLWSELIVVSVGYISSCSSLNFFNLINLGSSMAVSRSTALTRVSIHIRK